MSIDRAAAIAHVVYRLAPTTNLSILKAVHAILGGESFSIADLAAHLAKHRDLFRLSDDGWVYVGRDQPANPAAIPPHREQRKAQRSRAELLDQLRKFGNSFTFSQARQIGVQGSFLRELIEQLQIAKMSAGRYCVAPGAPTAKGKS